jgi:hypothetical protein
MNGEKAYYAHCQAIYETPQEMRDWELINELGYNALLFDHRVSDGIANAKRTGVDVMYFVFRPLVEKCQILFFRALPDGSIPAGVAKEIGYAREFDIPVLELPSSILRRTMTVNETKEYLKEVGQR